MKRTLISNGLGRNDHRAAASAAAKSTSAPAAISWSSANSSSLWLRPARHGMKIIAVGATRAMFSASWPARLGNSICEYPKPAAASAICERSPAAKNNGRVIPTVLEMHRQPAVGRHGTKALLQCENHRIEAVGVRVANIQHHFDA